MRKIYLFSAFVLGLAANPLIAEAQVIESENAYLSKCKSNDSGYFYKPSNAKAEYGFEVTDYGTYDKNQGSGYRLEYNDGLLTVSWYNYVENCVFPLEAITMEQKGDMLIFGLNANWDGPLATCICFYDLKATFSGVEPGRYKVSFDEGYTYSEVEIGMLADAPTDDIVYENNMIATEVRGIDAANECRLEKVGNNLTVVSDKKAEVEIYDANGLKMAAICVEPGDTIDLSTLPKGVYTAKISNDTATSTLRFIR